MFTRPQTPWSTALHFIDSWWPPLRPEDGVAEEELQAAEQRLGLPLPKMLRQWHAIAGHRQDFIGNQDKLLTVDELCIAAGALPLCYERDGILQWAILRENLGQDDPPVVYSYDDLPYHPGEEWPVKWIPMNQTVSEFLPIMVTTATLSSGIYNGRAEVGEEMISTVKREYDPFPFAIDNHNPVFCDDDTLIGFWRASKGQLLMDASMRRRTAVQEFVRRTGSRMQIRHENGARGGHCCHAYNVACRDFWPPYILREPYPKGIELPNVLSTCHARSKGREVQGESMISRFLNWLGGTDG